MSDSTHTSKHEKHFVKLLARVLRRIEEEDREHAEHAGDTDTSKDSTTKAA